MILPHKLHFLILFLLSIPLDSTFILFISSWVTCPMPNWECSQISWIRYASVAMRHQFGDFQYGVFSLKRTTTWLMRVSTLWHLLQNSKLNLFLTLCAYIFLGKHSWSYNKKLSGSTTSPACHETVSWIVLNKPIYITKQQVNKYDYDNARDDKAIWIYLHSLSGSYVLYALQMGGSSPDNLLAQSTLSRVLFISTPFCDGG